MKGRQFAAPAARPGIIWTCYGCESARATQFWLSEPYTDRQRRTWVPLCTAERCRSRAAAHMYRHFPQLDRLVQN